MCDYLIDMIEVGDKKEHSDSYWSRPKLFSHSLKRTIPRKSGPQLLTFVEAAWSSVMEWGFERYSSYD